jgi:acyl dehydratase
MLQVVPKDQLADYVGQEVGCSDWFKIDQARIDSFADATLDHQYIHVDKERAAETPFGTTIAHGYLTLSMLPHLTETCGIAPENVVMGINYGANKLRFLNPVKVDSEIRARVKLQDVDEKKPGQFLLTSNVTIEIKGEDKPAMIAETLAMFVVQ